MVDILHVERITRTETLLSGQGQTLEKIEKRLDDIDDKMDNMATAVAMEKLQKELVRLENSFGEKFLPKLLSEQRTQDEAIKALQSRQRFSFWASGASLGLSILLLLIGVMSLSYAQKVGVAVGTAAGSILPH